MLVDEWVLRMVPEDRVQRHLDTVQCSVSPHGILQTQGHEELAHEVVCVFAGDQPHLHRVGEAPRARRSWPVRAHHHCGSRKSAQILRRLGGSTNLFGLAFGLWLVQLRVVAVSYTHLDVYKRQLLCGAGLSPPVVTETLYALTVQRQSRLREHLQQVHDKSRETAWLRGLGDALSLIHI